MKLSLRYFLIACLLLGAVGIPWAWREWHARKAAAIEAEVKRLEKDLKKLYSEQPVITNGFFAPGQTPPDPRFHWRKWEKKVVPIEKRLEELTGQPSNRPPPKHIEML